MGEYVRSDDKLMKYWTQFPSDWMNLMTYSENLKLLHDKIESKNLKVAKTQTTIDYLVRGNEGIIFYDNFSPIFLWLN